jgi:NHLM bacteriocin system ABC transporter peptidase/ATP-binding protein
MAHDPSRAVTAALRFPPSRRARVPTVMQMEATECGAASLAMVMAYHGLHVPLEQLRVDCGISRDGSKAGNLARAARKYGFEAQGRRIQELDDAAKVPVPYIAFWGFHHFLVVEGFSATAVWVNDPASGPRRVTAEEFDESFTGVAIQLAPGPDFRPGGERRGIFRALAGRLGGLHRELLFILLVGLALVVPGLVIPAFVRVFVDQVLLDNNLQWTNPILWGLALTVVVQVFLSWLQRFYLLRIQTSLMVGMAGRFMWHVLRLPLVYFTQRFGGEIGSRATLNDRLAQTLSGDIAASAVGLLMMVFYFVIMLSYDVVLALLGLFFAAASIGVLRLQAHRRGDINRRMRADAGKWTGASIAGIQIIETLKAGGTESEFFARWAGYFAKVVNADAQLASRTRSLQALPTLLNALNSAAVLALGAHRVMNGHLSVGSLVAFQSLMAGFLLPVNTLVQLGTQLQEIEGDVERLDDVLQHRLDPAWEQQPAATPARGGHRTRLDGAVELRDVTFGYSPLEPALITDFNLKLSPGKRIALVGPSGSGKTTVARLLSGLYRPWSGEILFDGIPREAIPRRLLCASFALIDQDTFIFGGTARENITLWDETVAEAEMVRAARDACIHDDISARAGGYDHLIEEGGRNLSGGQQQRLEIARALALGPRILVLDEATSALDPGVELLVDRNIRRRGCSCIIIAHRLSTIRDADEIIVMDRGRIVERGTHEDLAAHGGLYASLIEN